MRVISSSAEEMHEPDWEDVSDSSISDSKNSPGEIPLEVSLTSPKIPSNVSRKRRALSKSGSKTTYIAASPRRTGIRPKRAPSPTSTPSLTPLQRPAIKPLVSGEEVHAALTHGARSSAFYVRDVGSFFFYIIKRPLSLFLALWVTAMILNMLAVQIRLVLSPLCILPVVSHSSLCTRTQSGANQDKQKYVPYMPILSLT